MLPAGHAVSTPKKLFTAGFTNETLHKAVLSGWERLHSSYQHVKLDPADADEQGAIGNALSSVEDNERLKRAAAAIVAPVDQQQQIMQQLRTASRTLFIICWHPQATEDAALRVAAFAAGANMVTHCCHAVAEALHQVAMQKQLGGGAAAGEAGGAGGPLVCDWCGLPGLSATEYWSHQQLYHIYHHNMAGCCQICHRHSQNLARHIHDLHHPTKPGPELRTGVFALCIVWRPSDGRFLMTQEFAGSGFWVPGGGVDPGESLVQGAVRECREEAGVDVVVKGILSLESHKAGEWRRVIFYAEPATPAAALGAKTMPDWDSAGACWVSLDQLAALPLRSPSEPCTWFPALANGPEQVQEGVAPLIGTLEMPEGWAEVFRGFPCQ